MSASREAFDTAVDALERAMRGICASAIERAEVAERALNNLLAIIHRDGGHHSGRVGLAQSVDDAHKAWGALILRAETAEATLAQVALDVKPLQDIAPVSAWGENVCAWAVERIAADTREIEKHIAFGRRLQDDVLALRAEVAALREACGIARGGICKIDKVPRT